MLALIPFGFGNRAPDIFGNVHTRLNDRGRTVYRDPGDYTGRHRKDVPNPVIWFLARLAGERV